MYYHVRSLSPYTEYELYVIAVNSIGRGPPSAPVIVTTGETSQYYSIYFCILIINLTIFTFLPWLETIIFLSSRFMDCYLNIIEYIRRKKSIIYKTKPFIQCCNILIFTNIFCYNFIITYFPLIKIRFYIKIKNNGKNRFYRNISHFIDILLSSSQIYRMNINLTYEIMMFQINLSLRYFYVHENRIYIQHNKVNPLMNQYMFHFCAS